MPLLTIEECREHCRVVGTANDLLLSAALAGATDAAAGILNRAIFGDSTEFSAARTALPDAAAAAQAAFDAAMEAADSETDATKAEMMRDLARDALDRAGRDARAVLNGIVANDSIRAAVKLILGHLFENAEAVAVVQGSVVELPLGAVELLRPYRRIMMP